MMSSSTKNVVQSPGWSGAHLILGLLIIGIVTFDAPFFVRAWQLASSAHPAGAGLLAVFGLVPLLSLAGVALASRSLRRAGRPALRVIRPVAPSLRPTSYLNEMTE